MSAPVMPTEPLVLAAFMQMSARSANVTPGSFRLLEPTETEGVVKIEYASAARPEVLAVAGPGPMH